MFGFDDSILAHALSTIGRDWKSAAVLSALSLANHDEPTYFGMNPFSEFVLDCILCDDCVASGGLSPEYLEDSPKHEELGWPDVEGRIKFLGVAALRPQETLTCGDTLRQHIRSGDLFGRRGLNQHLNLCSWVHCLHHFFAVLLKSSCLNRSLNRNLCSLWCKMGLDHSLRKSLTAHCSWRLLLLFESIAWVLVWGRRLL
jgi:hypothetical protein